MTFFEISGWLFGLLGTVVGIYAYLRTRNVVRISGRARVVPALRSLTSLTQAPSLSVEGRSLTGQLHVVRCAFKNTGTATLRDRDIVEPLRIRPLMDENSIVVFAGVESISGRNKTLTVEFSDDDIVVKWGYLDPGDNFSVAVLVQGKVEGANFEGQFVGGGRVVRGQFQDYQSTIENIFAGSATAVILMGGAILGVLSAIMSWDSEVWSFFNYDNPSIIGRVVLLSVTSILLNILTVGGLVTAAMSLSRVAGLFDTTADGTRRLS